MRLRFSPIRKFIATVVVMILSLQVVEAQRQPLRLPTYDNQLFHFGFILAFNQMSFDIDFIENYQMQSYSGAMSNNAWDGNWNEGYTYRVVGVSCEPSPGFTVGIVGNLRLGRYFDLRLIPSLSFGRRELEYYMYSPDLVDSPKTDNGFYVIDGGNATWDAVVIELPLHIKYKSKRCSNFGAYVIGGGNLKFDASGKKNTNKTDADQIIKVKTKPVDFAAEIGAGLDFYNNYFKFGVEVKMGFGLVNLLKKENQILDSSFDKLSNNTFQISFTFE